MLGKRSRSVIVRLSELLSPGIPLGFFIGEPSGNDHLVACDDNGKKPNNCHRIVERGHGVGLAIVVALEKPSSSSGSRGREGGGTGFYSKYFVCGPSGHGRSDWDQGAEEEEEEEDYTYVTFHGPRESFTMVYHDRCESEVSEGGDRDSDRGDSPGLGFLSSCQLCGKKLHGQDLYMYR